MKPGAFIKQFARSAIRHTHPLQKGHRRQARGVTPFDFQISAGKATRYEEASPPKPDQGKPESTSEHVGVGVRGKYFRPLAQRSNGPPENHVVVLDPEIPKAFPTSEAVNKALAGLLTLVQETRRLAARRKR